MRFPFQFVLWLAIGGLVVWGTRFFLTASAASEQVSAPVPASLPLNMILLGGLLAGMMLLAGRIVGGVLSGISDSTRVDDWIEEIAMAPFEAEPDLIFPSHMTLPSFESVSVDTSIVPVELMNTPRHFVWDESLAALEFMEGDYA